ncbi:hypothetical protein, variant [Verruconis gallopava]|uniref:DUF1275 domain protein n=1 Tax=Verruconis gallopava TaxID=253628 RepID=A0A0D1ZYB0_9PEZI|nr:uncharacterized protein PV09_09231 [Verruconis gallopava]XP_016208935.1 hypothetical protein, variant [Verruconis gallopava]KIV99064.1 hypothetical protein PV09_09231 [Verruconis gallopava]KIV99065.1 hypothetical protein, variant [Verruconis gallopava]
MSRLKSDLGWLEPAIDLPAAEHSSAIRKYLFSPLRVDFLIECELLLQTFSIGIQDAICYPDFRCFASNQTGNSVMFAVAVSGVGGDLFDIHNVSMSLGMFVAGALITGQIAHVFGTRQRLWLIVAHLLQTIMVFGAAAIQYAHGVQLNSPRTLGAIALLAFSSGAQVASMRPFRIQEITTAMATAAWVDLVIDKDLVALRNRSRNRRAAFLVVLVAGSFAGAFMRERIGSPSALVIAALCKTVVLLAFFLNRAQSAHEGDVGAGNS